MIYRNTPTLIVVLLSLILAVKTYANDIALGMTLYEQNCAACHSKDLGGAFGFNLKDGEWIHGSQSQQIMQNIKVGFSTAGMPGFGAMLSDEQIGSIVAYIFSKRQGFDKLIYKLYQMDSAEAQHVDEKKLIKSGKLNANFADFQLPEVQHYIIQFEGDFYTPENEPTRVWIEWGRNTDITFEIDGEIVERDNRFGIWLPTWPLKQGKQRLKITYRSGHDKPHMKNLSLIITNDDMSIKLFPASTKARAIMEGKKLELIAISKPLVQRVRTMDLPPYSISVGLPQKINYAFNTRQCSVVGLWKGDMLNIGPNVAGRGEDASLPLGDWVFHFPASLQHTKQSSCQYKGYQLVADNPVFTYQIDDVEYSLTAKASNARSIDFHYTSKGVLKSSLVFALPQANSLTWHSPQNSAAKANTPETKELSINPDAQGKFTISASFN